MAPYFPLTVCRSDGVLEFSANGKMTPNQPTNTDSTPEADGSVSFYKQLKKDDERALEWKAKLGGMLVEVLGESTSRKYILDDFPEGYVLWQRQSRKKKSNTGTKDNQEEEGQSATGVNDNEEKQLQPTNGAKDNQEKQVISTTGAKDNQEKQVTSTTGTKDIQEKQVISTAGTKDHQEKQQFDRSDVFLYGHPKGRGRRFRSPLDFFPHLLWLSTDVQGDANNCTCKLCDPTERIVNEEASKKKQVTSKADSKAISLATDGTKLISLSLPTLQRNAQSPEQKLDAEVNGACLYRPGEMVWFNKGPAWGLAVICKRHVSKSRPRYLLQPLSHPLHHPASQITDQESIRPWLAWSVPATTHPPISNVPYDQVPWERVIRGDFGRGDAEVDGSILSAKQIDGSYTLFERMDVPTFGPGEVQYTGMFLGAEKIWVGEPVRMRVVSDDVVIMVIHQMIESTTSSGSSVTIIGDIYKFVDMPMPYTDRKDWPTPDLPARVVADLRFRNETSDNAKTGVWHEWRLLEPMARRGIPDIKGRWYETRTLLPVLRGLEAFQREILQGNASDTSLWMNSRGDTSNGAGQRKKNRLDTLGRAVPSDLKISRGLNGPPADDVFPDEQRIEPNIRVPANDGSYGAVTQVDMDQFMNLDHGSVDDPSFQN